MECAAVLESMQILRSTYGLFEVSCWMSVAAFRYVPEVSWTDENNGFRGFLTTYNYSRQALSLALPAKMVCYLCWES